MAYLVFMLYYLSSISLVIYIFNQLLFLYAVAACVKKSCDALLFINDYFLNLSFVVLLLLRSVYVETNPGPKKLSVIKFFHWTLNGLQSFS